MEFCECGSLLVPTKDKKTGNILLVCNACGKVYDPNKLKADYEIKAKVDHKENEVLEVIEEDVVNGPSISEEEREELLEQYRETLELFEY